MADWDANSAPLEQNLLRVLETIRDNARRRTVLSVETARRWHAETLRNLTVPNSRYVGRFRGEPGLEKVQVHIGGQFGVAARDVSSALAAFERTLQPVIARLDILIPTGADPNADQLAAILEVCAWVHAEWIRIHPFRQRQRTHGSLVGQLHRHALQPAAFPATETSTRRWLW
jgi:hypothetical protein